MTGTEIIRETFIHISEDLGWWFGYKVLRLWLSLFYSFLKSILIVDECRFIIIEMFFFDFSFFGLFYVILIDLGIITNKLIHSRKYVLSDVHKLLLLPNTKYPIKFFHNLLSEEVMLCDRIRIETVRNKMWLISPYSLIIFKVKEEYWWLSNHR